MPYTLVKALAWLIIAFAIGIVIGWLLRNVIVRRQMAKARGDGAEQERLRRRVAELEPLIDERTRLLAELEAARSGRARSSGGPASTSPPPPATESPPAADAGTAVDEPPGAAGLAGAAAVLGAPVERDDLTVVEGIGPKIAELCHGIGIRTWADLADTEASLLRTMLADAGPRYQAHDPTTWPEQAGLLAAGEWAEFRALTDRLDGGTESP